MSVLLLGIAGFSMGEMLTGPKKSEYLGLISPPGKKGLYLGYVNIPVGIGGLVQEELNASSMPFFCRRAASKLSENFNENKTLFCPRFAPLRPVSVIFTECKTLIRWEEGDKGDEVRGANAPRFFLRAVTGNGPVGSRDDASPRK